MDIVPFEGIGELRLGDPVSTIRSKLGEAGKERYYPQVCMHQIWFASRGILCAFNPDHQLIWLTVQCAGNDLHLNNQKISWETLPGIVSGMNSRYVVGWDSTGTTTLFALSLGLEFNSKSSDPFSLSSVRAFDRKGWAKETEHPDLMVSQFGTQID
ncbi:unnamed protein product [uncultured bacterium]|nr:unnamed protein product [uncultured bacterium]